MSNINKRAHHNNAERKRRQNLKDSYDLTKDVLPMVRGGKASRGQILKEATAYINCLTKKNAAYQQDMDEIRSHIKALDEQIALLQRGKTPKNIATAALVAEKARIVLTKDSESDSPDSEDDLAIRKRKFK